MSKRPANRRPATFKLDDANVIVAEPREDGRAGRGAGRITPESEAAPLPVAVEATMVPAESRFRWGALFWGAVGGLTLLGAGLGVARLIEDLFARGESLGVVG